MRAAVTGAGGFIGSALTSLLLDRGWDVAALDLPRALARVPAGARRIGLDIRNQSALREALRGVHVLFHTAALFDRAAAWDDLYDPRHFHSRIGPTPWNWTHIQEVDAVIRPWVVRRQRRSEHANEDEAGDDQES